MSKGLIAISVIIVLISLCIWLGGSLIIQGLPPTKTKTVHTDYFHYEGKNGNSVLTYNDTRVEGVNWVMYNKGNLTYEYVQSGSPFKLPLVTSLLLFGTPMTIGFGLLKRYW